MIEKVGKAFGNLRIYVNAMNLRKTAQILMLAFLLMFFNIGSKYPAMSEINNTSISDSYTDNMREATIAKSETERYMKLYQEIYEKSLIQQIEFESEVLIPDYISFKYIEYAYKISFETNIPTRVMFRLIFKESSFDEDIVSRAGAVGLMQLMPSTRQKYYKDLRVDTLHIDKIQEDIYIGAYYLLDLQNFWRERGNPEKNLLKLSIAAYNAGKQTVITYKGVPPYKETTEFVKFILEPHSNPVFYSNILQKNNKKDVS